MSSLLELDNLAKYYGNIIALEGVTTTVEAGEVTCVLGDNGAGKSTFIKILAGVHQHDAGTVKLDGTKVCFESPRESLAAGIATVYQDLADGQQLKVAQAVLLASVTDCHCPGPTPARGSADRAPRPQPSSAPARREAARPWRSCRDCKR